jgi:DNA repair protein RadA/Sms
MYECEACGHRPSRWVGRGPRCDGWGTIAQVAASLAAAPSGAGTAVVAEPLAAGTQGDPERILTGVEGVDRVLGGGLVAGSVVLLAGEPGIGKSTLALQVAGALAAAGHPCLLASGEESRAQVAARAVRVGASADGVTFVPGRDLGGVVDAALASRPTVLVVDSVQTLRAAGSTHVPGGVARVRVCTDALVGMAKEAGIAVLLTGHVTKDGDLAGPRALEHAVDVVLTFEGEPRSGLRVLAAGKNRFGAEGETAWFEMGTGGLVPIDPTDLLVSGRALPGAAVALAQRGRRGLAIEVQALVGPAEGSGRRHATGLDLRRLQLVTAVLDRAGVAVGRSDVFGASPGGVRVDDPACDLAVAAAVASAATGVAPPAGTAFVGEIALTGRVHPAPAMAQRLQAARAAGCTSVFAPAGAEAATSDLLVHPVTQVGDALGWALPPAPMRPRSLPA